MNSELLASLGIFLGGTLIGSFGFGMIFVPRIRAALLGRIGFSRGQSRRSLAEGALTELHEEIEIFKQNLAVLDSYSAEYFHSFQEAGWHNLLRVAEELSALEASLRVFQRTRRYDEVREVSLLLLDRLPAERCKGLLEQHPVLVELVGWKPQAQQGLVKLIQVVANSAQRTRDLGVERKRPRKPTLLSLAELRQSLER
jgi:hypothetical protein